MSIGKTNISGGRRVKDLTANPGVVKKGFTFSTDGLTEQVGIMDPKLNGDSIQIGELSYYGFNRCINLLKDEGFSSIHESTRDIIKIAEWQGKDDILFELDVVAFPNGTVKLFLFWWTPRYIPSENIDAPIVNKVKYHYLYTFPSNEAYDIISGNNKLFFITRINENHIIFRGFCYVNNGKVVVVNFDYIEGEDIQYRYKSHYYINESWITTPIYEDDGFLYLSSNRSAIVKKVNLITGLTVETLIYSVDSNYTVFKITPSVVNGYFPTSCKNKRYVMHLLKYANYDSYQFVCYDLDSPTVAYQRNFDSYWSNLNYDTYEKISTSTPSITTFDSCLYISGTSTYKRRSDGTIGTLRAGMTIFFHSSGPKCIGDFRNMDVFESASFRYFTHHVLSSYDMYGPKMLYCPMKEAIFTSPTVLEVTSVSRNSSDTHGSILISNNGELFTIDRMYDKQKIYYYIGSCFYNLNYGVFSGSSFNTSLDFWSTQETYVTYLLSTLRVFDIHNFIFYFIRVSNDSSDYHKSRFMIFKITRNGESYTPNRYFKTFTHMFPIAYPNLPTDTYRSDNSLVFGKYNQAYEELGSPDLEDFGVSRLQKDIIQNSTSYYSISGNQKSFKELFSTYSVPSESSLIIKMFYSSLRAFHIGRSLYYYKSYISNMYSTLMSNNPNSKLHIYPGTPVFKLDSNK